MLAGCALVIFASFVPIPFLISQPGPTFNTIGEFQGKPLIKITGTRTYPTAGNLDLTTVSERGAVREGVFAGEVLVALARGDRAVVPRDSRIPPGVSGAEVAEANQEMFATSQSDAIGAALRELDIPVTESVVVQSVTAGTPAAGIVKAGDLVVRVAGHPVGDPADVARLVQAAGVGAQIDLVVRRSTSDEQAETTKELQVTAAANPVTGRAFLGLTVAAFYQAPFEIDFTLDSVGGPSAGLMFSLGIVDKLTAGELNGGKHVAGTGTISPDGTVGEIGGIAQKLNGARAAGAELFLAPLSNCADVVGRIPAGLQVVAVETLHQARQYVQEWAQDPTGELPNCSADGGSAG